MRDDAGSTGPASGRTRVLVLGYGNPGRQDDGLGPAVACGIGRMGWPNVSAYDSYQLNIEDALDVAEHDVVWFVDAARAGRSPFTVREVSPVFSLDFSSHLVRPEVVLALAGQYYGKSPRAFLMGIRGYQFEFIEALSAGAAGNLALAMSALTFRIRAAGGRAAA
jgi:hydrogenase maturation protease